MTRGFTNPRGGQTVDSWKDLWMLAVTADGPLDEEIPELTRMFLEEIVVENPTELTVKFLDGTVKRVRV